MNKFTADDAIETLAQTIRDLQAGDIKAIDAAEISNAIGKMINLAKTQLAYDITKNNLGNVSNIGFLESVKKISNVDG